MRIHTSDLLAALLARRLGGTPALGANAADGPTAAAAGAAPVGVPDAAPRASSRLDPMTPRGLATESTASARAPAAGSNAMTGDARSESVATVFGAAARLAAALRPASVDEAVRPPAPIAAGPAPADALAASLRESVAESGLFYESHLAQWVRGERPLASILREPQAGWSPGEHRPAADATASWRPTRSPVTDAPPAVEGRIEIMETRDRERRDATSPSAVTSPHRGMAVEQADPSAGPARDMVARQLHVLESGRVVWEGDVWPRQRVRLAIEGEPDSRPGATPAPPRAWNVKLSAVLPELGQVDATLRFDGTRASVALSAAPAAANALAAGRIAFEAALAAAGVQVCPTVVTRRG